MDNRTAADLIRTLELARHPEGGWYRETYRAAAKVPVNPVAGRPGGERHISTAIYFLLERGDISALHRIGSDELWHFYAGAPLAIHFFTSEGEHGTLRLGQNIWAGEVFQAMVPAGCWFGAEIQGAGPYSLVGCTVAPGFDFVDFELGERAELLRRYPGHGDIINRLTRG